MRLVSFELGGRASWGLISDNGIVDAGRRTGARVPDLCALLACDPDLHGLRELKDLSPDHGMDDVRYLPVIADQAARVLCVGVNYLPHIREMGHEPPEHPLVFIRFPSSLTGHGEALLRPRASGQFDYEGELAVIIGRPARHVPRERALEFVAGYSILNDGSVRDFQQHSSQFTAGKNFPHSGALGPWMATSDSVGDPAGLHLTTRLNGQVVQDSPVSELCFDVPALIAYCSTWTQLLPGDVISTGTPGGVGAARTPPLWLQPGDCVEVEVDRIGVLRNTIVDEGAD